MAVSEKELDEFVEETLKKDITQQDKIDESVEQHLQEMGWLWDKVNEKLKNDGTCFKCKREVDFSSEKINVLEATKTDKGVIAFVSVCEKCSEKLKNEKK